jgi:hypothetical protein
LLYGEESAAVIGTKLEKSQNDSQIETKIKINAGNDRSFIVVHRHPVIS